MKKLSTARVSEIAKNEALPAYMRQAAYDELRARREAKAAQQRETELALTVIFYSITTSILATVMIVSIW